MSKNRDKGDKVIASAAERDAFLVAQERAKKEAFLVKNKKTIADKKSEDEKNLIAKAAAENDMEFTKNENLYFDAVKSLGDLLDFIEEHGLKKLEKDKEKDIADLVTLSGELEELVNNKNFTKFAEDYAVFNSALKELDLQVKEELKLVKTEPESKENKQPEAEKKENKPVAAKTEEAPKQLSPEEERAEVEQRERLHGNLWQNFVLLSRTIKGADKNDRSRKLFEKYDNIMGKLKKYLDIARWTEDIKTFDTNINNFNEGFKFLMANLEPDLKEAYQNGGVLLKKEKPVEQIKPKKTEEPSKEVKQSENEIEINLDNLQETVEPESKVEVTREAEDIYEERKTKTLDVASREEIVKLESLLTSPEYAGRIDNDEWQICNNSRGKLETFRKEMFFKLRDYTDKEFERKYRDLKELTEKLIKQLTELKNRPAVESAPTEALPPESVAPPSAPKKSLWGRLKERGKKISDAVFNRETGKVAAKVTYDTIASVLGFKLATDAVRWAAKGEGDLAEWWNGRKESKNSKEAIAKAYAGLMESFQKNKENKVLEESEKIEKRLADFNKQIESTNLAPEVKKALLNRFWEISLKHQTDTAAALQERNTETQRTLDAYLQAKVSGMKIARDVMNFALTATGMSMLRGIAYAGAAIAERAGKAKREFAKQTLGADAKKAELKFVAKDVFVTSAIETARALTGRGEKEGKSVTGKTIDFIKALGIVARGFGIYGVAVSVSYGGEPALQSIDKVLSAMKADGVVGKISKVGKLMYHNFVQNAEHVMENMERVGRSVTHPTEAFDEHASVEIPKSVEQHELPPTTEPTHPYPAQAGIPVETSPVVVEPSDHNTIEVVTLNDAQGVDHGLNKLMHDHPEFFKHKDGTSWNADEIHKWRVEKLQEMGVKFKGSLRSDPVVEHGGAQMEFFTDKNGQVHVKWANSEHLTFKKNPDWKETEPQKIVSDTTIKEKSAEQIHELRHKMAGMEATPSVQAHEFAHKITDTAMVPESAPKQEIQPSAPAPTESAHHVEKTITTHKASKPEPVVESKAPTPKPVESKPAVAPVEKKITPEKVFVATPDPFADALGYKFLKDHGSSHKEFFDTFDKMRGEAKNRLDSSFIYENGSYKFFNKKMDDYFELTDLSQVEKMFKAEELYRAGKSDWVESLNKAMFSKDDSKVMQLAFAEHKDTVSHPILTNNSHAVRIWDSAKKKDVFWYDKKTIFSLNKNGDLVMKDNSGQQVMTKEEILNMIK